MSASQKVFRVMVSSAALLGPARMLLFLYLCLIGVCRVFYNSVLLIQPFAADPSATEILAESRYT